MADSNPYTANNTDTRETTSSTSAFCQECGRALTTGTLRRVAGGVYCLPCAAQRSATSGWQAVPAGSYAGGQPQGVPFAPGRSNGPNPGAASVLGFIPGVGAMYNGQYAKAAMHLIVFVGLLTLADHLNWVFYWLVWGWVFYQVFDAYHTARARRDGLPLPNPFGWNEIGERFGFTSTSPGAVGNQAGRPNAGTVPPFENGDSGTWPRPGTQGTLPEDISQAPGSRSAASHNVSAPPSPFVPPAMPVGQPPFQSQASFQNASFAPGRPRETAWQAAPIAPYIPTYMGDPAVVDGRSPSSSRRFPIGALWLIGLGTVFLLGNVMPHFAIKGHWLVPALLFGVALWSGMRRLELHREAVAAQGKTPNLACALVGPVMLLTLSVLMGLQAGHRASLGRTWPVMLVVWGGLLLAQRASGPSLPFAAPDVPEPLSAPPVRSTSGTGSLGL